MIVSAAFESPAVIASFDDIAVMSEAIEQRGGHLGVSEDGRPLTEAEVGCDDDAGALVEPAEQVEEQSAARV